MRQIAETGKCLSYKGFDPQRLDNELELMGEVESLVHSQFSRGLAKTDAEANIVCFTLRHMSLLPHAI